MNKKMLAKANRWHVNADAEISIRPSSAIETKETKYIIVRERDISYRFYLHQHPFAQRLIQRLLRKGTAGLQAADTEYEPGAISLPYGVDFKLESGLDSPIPPESRIRLLDKVTATGDAGATVELAPKDEFEIADRHRGILSARPARGRITPAIAPSPL